MADINTPVSCPYCRSNHVKGNGFTDQGKHRFRCQSPDCKKSFICDYDNIGWMPKIKEMIKTMAMNGSGIRDTARVLKISPDTVISTLKKTESELENVNRAFLESIINPEECEVIFKRIDQEDFSNWSSPEGEVSWEGEADVDEMWSYVRHKGQQRWLWHAIDHKTGTLLAYTFGRREDAVFQTLKRLLRPFGIKKFNTDNAGVYNRNIIDEEHEVGKPKMQKIERKHLTFRTRLKRLARKTICFSKTIKMHDIVIGLFINIFEFGRQLLNC